MDSRPRAIYIVSNAFQCGAQRQAVDLSTHFASRGWRITAYTRDLPPIDRQFREAGIDLRHAPLVWTFDIPTIWRLAHDLRHERPGTIVHVQRFSDAFCVLAARRLARRNREIRVAITCHRVRKAKDSALARRIYRNLDAIIFDSHLARDRFLSTWPDGRLPFPEERLHVVHGGVNIPLAPRTDEPQSGPIVAMFHGRLTPEKGLETLIDSLYRLKGKRTRLWIVGSGDPDYVDALRRRAIARGVMEMIDWKGYADDIHSLIRQSHFGVLPSVAPASYGLANIEYMANGRPQITTCHGAPAEYLEPGREALLIAPANAQALGDALVRMASDADLRLRMGQTAYQKYRNELSWDHVAPEIEAIYRSL